MRLSPNFPRYTRTLLLCVLLALGAVAALNLLVDPYDLYRIAAEPRLHDHKNGLSSRIAKGAVLSRPEWDTVILGNSRAEIGLDPQHPGWQGQRVFNASLAGANFPEITLAARLALHSPRLRRLVIAIDVRDFEPHPRTDDYLVSLLNPDLNPVEYHLANLLSIRSTERSLGTLSDLFKHRLAPTWRQGIDENPVKTFGHSDWTLAGYHDYFAGAGPAGAAGSALVDPDQLLDLAKLLDDASRQGVRVQLVQLPFPAMFFEVRWVAGEWDTADQWERDIVRIVAEHNARFPAVPAEFWDFADYSPYAVEAVPPPGAKVTHMHWFWDVIHFKKELGDLVIDRLTDYPTGTDLNDLGAILTPQNVAHHQARLKRDHEAFPDKFQN